MFTNRGRETDSTRPELSICRITAALTTMLQTPVMEIPRTEEVFLSLGLFCLCPLVEGAPKGTSK